MEKLNEKIMNEIGRFDEIRVYNYEYYCPMKCYNGGCPYFVMGFIKINDNDYKVYYGTSSEFDYCHKLGEFRDCINCMYYDYENDKCTIDYKHVNIKELIAIIIDAMKNDHKEIIGFAYDDEFIIKEVKYPHYDCEKCYNCGYEKDE